MKRIRTMQKASLIKDMRAYAGNSGFITRQQLAGYMNRKDAHGVDKFLYPLQRIDKKYYFIPDVVDSILSIGGGRRG